MRLLPADRSDHRVIDAARDGRVVRCLLASSPIAALPAGEPG